jgi:hypothetical protein
MHLLQPRKRDELLREEDETPKQVATPRSWIPKVTEEEIGKRRSSTGCGGTASDYPSKQRAQMQTNSVTAVSHSCVVAGSTGTGIDRGGGGGVYCAVLVFNWVRRPSLLLQLSDTTPVRSRAAVCALPRPES